MYVLVVLFGVGSWVTLNGLWVELPLMVPHLPEGWTLPSYLNVIIQAANIGPVGIALLLHFAKEKVNDKYLIYFLVVTGSVATFLLVFCWETTSIIAESCHSVGLFSLVFVLAVVCCSSSVIFLPFMTLFKKQYVTAFFIGQGISGLIPSVVAMAQGVGSMTCENMTSLSANMTEYYYLPVYKQPRFSVEYFILFIFATMVLCFIAFTLLNKLAFCKREFASTSHTEHIPDYDLSIDTKETLLNQSKITTHTEPRAMNAVSSAGLLILNVTINAIANGCLPPVQTYSCLPYGNSVYHWSVTLSNIANPLACFVAFVFPIVPRRVIYGVTSAGFATAAYIMYTAVSSPHPVFAGSVAGPALVVRTKTNMHVTDETTTDIVLHKLGLFFCVYLC